MIKSRAHNLPSPPDSHLAGNLWDDFFISGIPCPAHLFFLFRRPKILGECHKIA